MPRTETLKPAQSTNPRWLDAARAFYAESFGALRRRELRAAKEDWSDLTEEEQTFALAHLQYLDLMAQAGTQRLLVQVRDLLEEIADGLAAEREVRDDATGEEDEYEDDGEPEEEPIPFEPPAEPGPALVEAAGEEPEGNDDDGEDEAEDSDLEEDDDDEDDPGDEPADGGGRAA
jgi:hypothetical protein